MACKANYAVSVRVIMSKTPRIGSDFAIKYHVTWPLRRTPLDISGFSGTIDIPDLSAGRRMAVGEPDQEKRRALRAARALNPQPQAVQDDLFRSGNPFFDPEDLVQVKYEMLRRVRQEQRSVTEAARLFGFSRFAFYQTLRVFESRGLPGLLRQPPGPRRRHKLDVEAVAFLRQQLMEHPELSSAQLADRLKQDRGVQVHPRSIERALKAERVKGGHSR
jgi:transposase